jgi:hypothetical protein
MIRPVPRYFYVSFIIVAICFDTAPAQNIVESNSTNLTANPVTLTGTDASEFFFRAADFQKAALNISKDDRLLRKLNAHIAGLLEGEPWVPLHHTLGISGYETYFDHPDEYFYALSIAMPFLHTNVAEKIKQVLDRMAVETPPFAKDGFDRRLGRARESYDVPGELRRPGKGSASSLFGVYACWSYCFYTSNKVFVRVKELPPLPESPYKFNIRSANSGKDEPEKLNGDLAGIIGFIRLARAGHDQGAEEEARKKFRELLELRINLERVNPRILEKTLSASKSLHNYKLTRYCDLVPEVGAAVHKWSGGCGPANLKAFREERNGWYLAFGDRMIGGENYTTPLHFSRALFAGATFIEQLPGEQLAKFVDVPWCKADLYFIEKCVYALWAKAGRPWTELK